MLGVQAGEAPHSSGAGSPPLVMAATMHPLTLRFSDAALERRLRAEQFASSYTMYVLLLTSFVILHLFVMPILSPDTKMVSMIFAPICFVAGYGRVVISARYRDDQFAAHEATGNLWFWLVALGFPGLRVCLWTRLQPAIGDTDSTLYMSTIMLVAITSHLMYFDFRLRMQLNFIIFTSLASGGWLADDSLSVRGQPYDTLAVTLALASGVFVGHSIESMLRGLYLASHNEARSRAAEAGATAPSSSMISPFQDAQMTADLRGHGFDVLGILGRGSMGDTTDPGLDPRLVDASLL